MKYKLALVMSAFCAFSVWTEAKVKLPAILSDGRIFHAKYLFLGNDLYITDTLNVIELKDLDMGVLSRLSELECLIADIGMMKICACTRY